MISRDFRFGLLPLVLTLEEVFTSLLWGRSCSREGCFLGGGLHDGQLCEEASERWPPAVVLWGCLLHHLVLAFEGSARMMADSPQSWPMGQSHFGVPSWLLDKGQLGQLKVSYRLAKGQGELKILIFYFSPTGTLGLQCALGQGLIPPYPEPAWLDSISELTVHLAMCLGESELTERAVEGRWTDGRLGGGTAAHQTTWQLQPLLCFPLRSRQLDAG